MADETEAERQLVAFDLGGEHYGVDIGTVREIILMQTITQVPNTPDAIEGVINLRGRIVPVVDLRKRFGLQANAQTNESRIVVVDIGDIAIGVMVDAVTEVLRIPARSIESASCAIATADSYYLEGIANLGTRLIIILDLAKALASEAGVVEAVAA